MSLELKLPKDQLEHLVSGAILQALNEEARAELIQKALEHLLTPQSSSYIRAPGKSPLQDTFDRALSDIAFGKAKELLTENAEVNEAITSFMAKVVQNLLQSEEAVEGMARFLQKAISNASYNV